MVSFLLSILAILIAKQSACIRSTDEKVSLGKQNIGWLSLWRCLVTSGHRLDAPFPPLHQIWVECRHLVRCRYSPVFCLPVNSIQTDAASFALPWLSAKQGFCGMPADVWLSSGKPQSVLAVIAKMDLTKTKPRLNRFPGPTPRPRDRPFPCQVVPCISLGMEVCAHKQFFTQRLNQFAKMFPGPALDSCLRCSVLSSTQPRLAGSRLAHTLTAPGLEVGNLICCFFGAEDSRFFPRSVDLAHPGALAAFREVYARENGGAYIIKPSTGSQGDGPGPAALCACMWCFQGDVCDQSLN